MKTLILEPNNENIEFASKLLQDGQVVGVPTETVYGLAGDCNNPLAVKRIFEAKGRPNDNPLIVHISNMNMLNGIVSTVTEDVKKLAEVFWPGPLTMIMPKGKNVCSETTAGLDSVGVRMPDNDVAIALIEKSGVPFAAPSANISGKPSPTSATDVYVDMNGRIPVILDGGECFAGVESTVVSMLGENPIILRPGVITKDDIEKALKKPVFIAKEVTEGVVGDSQVLSPGMKYKHYSPAAEVIIIRSSLDKFVEYVNNNKADGVFAMCFKGEEQLLKVQSLAYGESDNPKSQAHNLFAVLRRFDEFGANKVYARCPESSGVALAVYNRLIRSAGFKIIDL